MAYLHEHKCNPSNQKEWFELEELCRKIWFDGKVNNKLWELRNGKNNGYISELTHEINTNLGHTLYLKKRAEGGDKIDYKDMVRHVVQIYLLVSSAEIYVEHYYQLT